MSRPYDDPPPPSALQAVTYEEKSIHNAQGQVTDIKRMYRFDFSKFTPAVMLGGDEKRWTPGELHGHGLYEPISTIPLGNLARWVYRDPGDPKTKQTHWEDKGLETKDGYKGLDELSSALVYALKANPFNPMEHLAAINEEHGYIESTLPSSGEQAMFPAVVLRLEVDSHMDHFVEWYEDESEVLEARIEKRKVAEECAPLRESRLGAGYSMMKYQEGKQRDLRKKLSSCLSVLSTGAAVLEVVEAFARPAQERKSMWPGHKKAGYNFVYPEPNDGLRGKFKRFKGQWHTELLGRAAAVIRNSEIQAAEEKAAVKFMEGLREPGAPYIEMLEDYGNLLPGSKAILWETLLEGIKRCLLVPRTRKQLAHGELRALAQLSAGLPGVDPPKPGKMSAAEKKVREALSKFDPALLAPKEPTPLGKFASEKLLAAKDWQERGGLMLNVLALATPLLVTKTGEAQDDVVPAAAWLWKSLMGTCEFTEQEAVSFWPWKNKTHPDVKDIERVEDSIFHKVGAKVDPLFQFANVAARSLHLYYAVEEFKKAADEETPLKALEAGESLLKFSQMLVGLAADNAGTLKSLFEVDIKVGGAKKFASGIGVVTDVIAFAIAFQKWKALKDKGVSARLREKERMDLLLEYVTLALSLLTAAAGAELLILAAVVALAKVLLTDLDAWMPLVVPILGTKPASHSYLEALLKALLVEDDEYAKARKTIKNLEMTQLHAALTEKWAHLDTNPLDTTQVMWDVSGPAGSELADDAKKIIEEHWKGRLGADAIVKILK